jgi:hypothetical protein
MVVTYQDLSSVSLVAGEVISKTSEASVFSIKIFYRSFSPPDKRYVSHRYNLPRLYQFHNICIDR